MGNGNGGLVILDGPDACGKTTLAKALLDGDEAGYVHLTYDPTWEDPNRTLWKLQYFSLVKAAIRLDQGKLTVIDRHWMSEQVYARVYRGGSDLTAESRQWDRVIQRLCGVYVICAPQPESATSRHHMMHEERSEMYPPSDDILAVARKFRKLYDGNWPGQVSDYAEFLMSQGGMRMREDALLYDIDVDGDNLRMVCSSVQRALNRLQVTQYPPAFSYNKGNYLGHPSRAKFLFVGERINPKKRGMWPFIDYGASSRTLGNVLQDLQFDERDAMWTNAYAADEHVKTLVEWFPHLKVIALGGEAVAYLEEIDVPCFKVVHPAFAQRFNKVDFFKVQLGEVLR